MARDDELPEHLDLDSEGVHPLEGALPEKEITGDPQEGIWPPPDYPLAWRVLRQDTLVDRLREEMPDRIRPDDQPALLIDDQPETGDGIDAGLSVAAAYRGRQRRRLAVAADRRCHLSHAGQCANHQEGLRAGFR